MKSGKTTTDNLLDKVRSVLRSYRGNPNYDDLVGVGVLAALEHGGDRENFVAYINKEVLRYLYDLKNPVRVPHTNQYDKRVSVESRNLGLVSYSEVKEESFIVEDHSDEVLFKVWLDNLGPITKGFVELKLSGATRAEVMETLNISKYDYYELLSSVRESHRGT